MEAESEGLEAADGLRIANANARPRKMAKPAAETIPPVAATSKNRLWGSAISSLASGSLYFK